MEARNIHIIVINHLSHIHYTSACAFSRKPSVHSIKPSVFISFKLDTSAATTSVNALLFVVAAV